MVAAVDDEKKGREEDGRDEKGRLRSWLISVKGVSYINVRDV
jgi:hypothetical protein